mgnify:CR=1 FL=1
MKLIYTQETINYMAKVNPHLLEQLSKYGVPEGPFELADDKGTIINKYYLYKINDDTSEHIS